MNVFSNFKVRSRQRDRSTDETRLEGLLQFLGKLTGEAKSELDGLKKRYDQASADAAFACMEEENEGSSKGASDRIGVLTETIMNYADRVRHLERQVAYFEQLERDISAAADTIVHPVSGGSVTADS
ncbi:MAG: hypothetical protein WAU86_07930 [Oricola sp.]